MRRRERMLRGPGAAGHARPLWSRRDSHVRGSSRPAKSGFGVVGALPLKGLEVTFQGGRICSARQNNTGETSDMTARPQLPERTPRAKGEPTALDGLLVVDFTGLSPDPPVRKRWPISAPR